VFLSALLIIVIVSDNSKNGTLSQGALIGVAVGCAIAGLLILAAIILVVIFVRRRNRQKDDFVFNPNMALSPPPVDGGLGTNWSDMANKSKSRKSMFARKSNFDDRF
jgi:hypothetical protein